MRALRDGLANQASWEPRLVDQCYSKLAARPKRGRAILFYSQHPDGSLDGAAQHGGCPVLEGQKWAANLWVWNKAMPFGSTRFQVAGKGGKGGGGAPGAQIDVVFHSALDGIEIFWKGGDGAETKMGDLVENHPFTVNSYLGHAFAARRRGELLGEYAVAAAGNSFTVA